MQVRIESPRGAAAPSPAVLAALAVALDAAFAAPADDAVAGAPASPWRLAGRSVEAFDAYDSARYAHLARRGRA